MQFSEVKALVAELATPEYRRDHDAVHAGMVRLLGAMSPHTLDNPATIARAVAWLEKLTERTLFRCDHCSKWRDAAGQSETHDGDHVCSECCGKHYFTCEDCDGIFPDSDQNHAADRVVCGGCHESYRECRDCSHVGHQDDMANHYGDWLCPRHYDQVCDDDAENNDRDDSNLLDHDADVTHVCRRQWLYAPGEKTDGQGNGLGRGATLWMGFELEVVARDGLGEDSDSVKTLLAGRGIVKSDGSLPDDGFEIVSLPGTLAYHQTQWGAFLDKLPAYARGWNQDTCGMHVHIARDALTPLVIGRLGVFITDRANRRFIEKVAGRSETEYCQHFNKGLTESLPQVVRHIPRLPNSVQPGCDCRACDIQRAAYVAAIAAEKEGGVSGKQLAALRAYHDGALSRACRDRKNGDRYQAINLNNDATIEIRIFQSNVAKLGFLKNLEFCHAAVKFCEGASNLALTSKAFLDWIALRRGMYPNFVQWAVREKLLTTKHTPKPGAAPLSFAA